MRLSLKNQKWKLLGCLLAFLALYFLWDYEIQSNFGTIQEGKIYRSGQPREAQLERWIRKYHLRTIIVLKPTLEDPEIEMAQRYGVKVHHIPLGSHHGPSEAQWQRILALLTDEQNFPLLYHCHKGADKTGIITAMYRVEVQHWALWKALLEMDLHYHVPFSRPGLQKYLRSRYEKLVKTSFSDSNVPASPSCLPAPDRRMISYLREAS
jgi:protein tyrosine/serine phosphatase